MRHRKKPEVGMRKCEQEKARDLDKDLGTGNGNRESCCFFFFAGAGVTWGKRVYLWGGCGTW